MHHDEPDLIMTALYDNVSRHVVEVDMIQMNGPEFAQVDNRLLSLQLVKRGYTDAVLFGPDGHNLQASAALYKKNILAIRGSFRPVTKVNIDMIMNGYNMFIKEQRVDRQNLQVLFEITLNNLRSDTGDVDEKDFIDRADILCSLGQTVLISNYQEYYKLVEYFSRYTKARMGLIMGVNNLIDVFDEKYYRHLNGGMLEAFGILFTRDLKIYIYPSRASEEEEIMTTASMPVHPRLRPLYDYLLFNKRLVDIDTFDPQRAAHLQQAGAGSDPQRTTGLGGTCSAVRGQHDQGQQAVRLHAGQGQGKGLNPVTRRCGVHCRCMLFPILIQFLDPPFAGSVLPVPECRTSSMVQRSAPTSGFVRASFTECSFAQWLRSGSLASRGQPGVVVQRYTEIPAGHPCGGT